VRVTSARADPRGTRLEISRRRTMAKLFLAIVTDLGLRVCFARQPRVSARGSRRKLLIHNESTRQRAFEEITWDSTFLL
jgi:hypothetical protein